MLLTDFRDRFLRRVLRFVWRQWAELGVAASRAEARDHWVIDPEALVLLTSTFGRHEARLFDESMDWLRTNAAFMNVPRLKSVSRRSGLGDIRVVSAMADVVGQYSPRLNWRFGTHEAVGDPEPLFQSMNHDVPVDFGRRDETFLRYGFTRGQVELRGLSLRFNPAMAECALLRLRALFGVTARAEIVLYLLTHDSCHPSAIARETGFSQKNIQDTLVDMVASGLIQVGRAEGRKKHYFIREKDQEPFFSPAEGPPRWITWPPLFVSLERVWRVVSDPAVAEHGPLLLASVLKELMTDLRPTIQHAGYAASLSGDGAASGEAYVAVFMEDIDRLLTALGA